VIGIDGLVHVELVMGMAVSFDLCGPVKASTRGALDDVIGWLHHVDATFSTYRDDSQISRLGRGEIPLTGVTDEVQNVLRTCLDLSRSTAGIFDVFSIPAPNGTTLDPSGYVKGWSIECAAGMFIDAGLTDFCINAGGDVAVRGQPSSDEPWRIGIRHPDFADRLATYVDLCGTWAIATSATYERGAHILDPRSGLAVTDLASATVLGHELGTVDAFATTVFVMGTDGLDWIEDLDGFEAYIITHDGIASWTSGFPITDG
jgi:thiamine biosynthesis lipoprotein